MGVAGTHVTKADDIQGAVAAAFKSGKPHLIEIEIEGKGRKVPIGGGSLQSITALPLYDEGEGDQEGIEFRRRSMNVLLMLDGHLLDAASLRDRLLPPVPSPCGPQQIGIRLLAPAREV